MIVFGGAGPRALADMGSLQDANHVELMRPITKWSVSVPSTDRIQEYVDAAFRIAQGNLPGPVFLEMPLDLLMNWADDAPPPTATNQGLGAGPRPGGDPDRIAAAAEILKKSERPMFIVGSPIRWSPKTDAVRKPSPTRSTRPALRPNRIARGALRYEHKNLMTRSRKVSLSKCDACFVFGTPFDFRLEYGRAINSGAKVVHVDLDANEVGFATAASTSRSTATAVSCFVRSPTRSARKIGAGWLAEIRAAEDKSRAKMAAEIASDADPPNPLRVCAELGKRLGKNDVVIGDGGDFVATAAYVLKMEWPQIWMDPGPLGTLGVGPGYAMAAKLARPDANVVLVYGDGSFGFHALEFEAMVRQNIPVVSVIGNDAAWTQIRRGQVELYGPERAPATSLGYTRYDKVVEALGGFGAYVEKTADLGPALDAAFASKKPACVNVKIAGSDFRKGAISV